WVGENPRKIRVASSCHPCQKSFERLVHVHDYPFVAFGEQSQLLVGKIHLLPPRGKSRLPARAGIGEDSNQVRKKLAIRIRSIKCLGAELANVLNGKKLADRSHV